MNQVGIKFPHSPILHYAFSSWREKILTKKYISTRKTDLFYNSMELCGILPRWEGKCHLHKTSKLVYYEASNEANTHNLVFASPMMISSKLRSFLDYFR